MTLKLFFVGFLCFVALPLGATEASAQNLDDCRAVLAKRGSPAQDDDSDPCNTLSVMVFALSRVVQQASQVILGSDPIPVSAIFSQRDLQGRTTQQPSLEGTPAQGHAIPSVQPAGVASGTIAALGTDAGEDAIAALSLNPAVLFLAEEANQQLAKLSRLADITVFVPVSGITKTKEPASSDRGKLKYVGARIRLNFNGASAGSTVWNGARELILKRVAAAGRDLQKLRSVLKAAPDLAACANTLLDNGNTSAVTASCGAPFSFDVDLNEAAQLREELVKVRRAADAKYFGADVRFDSGDPTMGAVQNASGQFLFAGLSVGRRFVGNGTKTSSAGVRARLGVRHAKLDNEDKSEFAAEGGVGFELARSIDDEELNVSGALEFRHGNAAENLADRFQTNFAMLRGSISVPITSGNSLSINIGVPVSGDVSPILSVNYNWGLLLPDRPAVR